MRLRIAEPLEDESLLQALVGQTQWNDEGTSGSNGTSRKTAMGQRFLSGYG
jgi:hypothetical protein